MQNDYKAPAQMSPSYLLCFRALFTKQYHAPLSSRSIAAFIRRIRVQNVLSGNNFCPVKVCARKMHRCNKTWMQSSASVKDFLVEIVSQLYAGVWLAHDLSHIRITFEGGCNRLFPSNTQRERSFLAGKRFVMAKDD